MNYWKAEDGWPFPEGAAWVPGMLGFNFSLYSKSASTVSLHFFKTTDPAREVFSYAFNNIKNRTGSIWHCFISESLLNGGDCFGYRVDGDIADGNHFDKEKLLLDPWAKSVFFPPQYSRTAALVAGDNTGKAPLSLLIKRDSDPPGFKNDVSPIHFHDLVIYEMHIKGFTKNSNSGVADNTRGTFTGIIEKIPYLVELGITAIELMPVHQFDPKEDNYWGYMTLNFFSPHQSYGSSTDSWALVTEFKQMVMELHKAGIEVILDVIFNHSAEGGKQGPLYSYKGIDNSSYYLLTADMKHYIDDAGTGNVMRTSYKIVRKLILDSLRYWVTEMHVDGFRFDLASIFTRNDDASVNLLNPPVLEEISMDPVLSKVRLIAEPWDINSYQLGQRFPGAAWAQWNGAYRDDIRRFVKGDENMVAKAMTRIYGSPDLFPPDKPYYGKPWQSINFINSHDGFTLYDTLSYNQKHNSSNGFNNTDGSNDNFSWNCGQEGDNQLPAEILQLRKKQAKNLITILLLSNGIPMFRMGDEFLHTQLGNNNPFNQDNETSWLDWSRKDKFPDIFRFTKCLIHFRKAHPSLLRGAYWQDDIKWFGVQGNTDISYYSRTLAFFLSGSTINDDDFYVMINMYWEPLTFIIQEQNSSKWKCIVNTALTAPADYIEFENADFIHENSLILEGRSVLVLTRKLN